MSDDLLEAARDAAAKAYAPGSNFPVGAAIRGASGKVYAGCNIENQSFPEGWCAETSAISHMVMAGEREIAEVLVYAPRKAGATPCGGCRQRLAEFAKSDVPVYLCDGDGIIETTSVGALLPADFNLAGLS